MVKLKRSASVPVRMSGLFSDFGQDVLNNLLMLEHLLEHLLVKIDPLDHLEPPSTLDLDHKDEK